MSYDISVTSHCEKQVAAYFPMVVKCLVEGALVSLATIQAMNAGFCPWNNIDLCIIRYK